MNKQSDIAPTSHFRFICKMETNDGAMDVPRWLFRIILYKLHNYN